MTDRLHPSDGDHRFVAVPVAATTVTFYLASSNTSSNDTETSKYFDNFARTANQFDLVADQAITLVGVNGTDFTDAIPMNANYGYAENWGSYTEIKVKTTAANTNISLKVR